MDGQENGSVFGLGVEGQVALTGRLAVHGGVGLGVLQLHDERVMNEELRGAFGAEYTLAVSYDFFPYKRRHSGGLGLAPVAQVRFLPGDERDRRWHSWSACTSAGGRGCPATSWTCPPAKHSNGIRATSGPAGQATPPPAGGGDDPRLARWRKCG